MAIPNGKLYLLMSIDKRSEIAMEIATHLVQKYGLTLSIVPDLQQVCPKCSQQPSDTDCASSSTTATATTVPDEPEHLEETTTSSASTSESLRIPEKSPECSRKRKIEEEITPLMKRLIKEEDDDVVEVEANEVLGTVLKAMQNGSTGGGEIKFSHQLNGHSEQSSDDGTSNSNDNFEADDDDYDPMPWSNTEFLANFITSQPAIFHSNGVGNANFVKDTKSAPSSSEKKERVPNSIVTSNGKTRRGRIVYSQQDLNILEQYYVEDPNACANPTKRDIMCNRLNVDYHRLKVWFQNRRRKDKVRSQEEAAIINAPEY